MLSIIRGLVGSGKSTYGAALAPISIAADDYFVGPDGVYRFDPRKLGSAHQYCQGRAREIVNAGGSVAVCNTFTERWEIEPYIRIAEEAGIPWQVIDLFDAGLSDRELADRNVHGVPVEVIRAMRDRYQHDWTKGDPRAPWER